MKKEIFEIINNVKIAENVFEMTLSGDVSEIKSAGQFVNVSVPDCYLRRPISVADSCADKLTLVYKVVGKGTDIMSGLKSGDKLDILVGLGNGYDLSASGERPLLIGGGVGIPPLYMLFKELIKEGKKPLVALGFNTKSEIFYSDRFAALGADVYLTTVDGSQGAKGFVTDVIKTLDYTYFYACGPMPMFRAIESVVKTDGEYSMEEKMACGFGACMGCSCKTKGGSKRVCKDGPVFKRSEILW